MSKPWKELMQLMVDAESPELLSALLELMLTIEERETLASRFLIIKALIEGKLTQRQIAEKMGVSISQITRGSNALKIIDAKLQNFLSSKL